MHKRESNVENETNKILRDFEIQTGNLIPVRRIHTVLKRKKRRICRLEYFAVRADHRKEINKKIKNRQLLGPCLRSQKSV